MNDYKINDDKIVVPSCTTFSVIIKSANSDDNTDIGANFGTSIPKYSNNWLISDLQKYNRYG